MTDETTHTVSSTTHGSNQSQRNIGVAGMRWYHFGFAMAFGLGGAILPPEGVITISGWVGGAVGAFVSAFLITGLSVFATRQVNDWRPADIVGYNAPDSRFKYLIFTSIALELFIFATTLKANTSLGTKMYLLFPLHILISGTIVGDMFRLRSKGVDWETKELGYPVLSLVLGFVGGLVYWYQRGRKRTVSSDSPDHTESTPAETAQAASEDGAVKNGAADDQSEYQDTPE